MNLIKLLHRRKYLFYQLTETGESQILTTDSEARVMQSKDGYHCYYNVQTADATARMTVTIAAFNAFALLIPGKLHGDRFATWLFQYTYV